MSNLILNWKWNGKIEPLIAAWMRTEWMNVISRMENQLGN